MINSEKQKYSYGWIYGLVGVVIFSGSLPATRMAMESLPPVFLTGVRGVIAALLSGLTLFTFKMPWPNRSQSIQLFTVALGVVLGFPLLSALALRHITSAHSVVYMGLLPLVTAAFGVLLGGERPKAPFWFFSSLGSLIVFALAFSKVQFTSLMGDALMVAAIVVCGFGYATGAKLSKTMGGCQVICWALILALPMMLLISLFCWPTSMGVITFKAWIGLGYVSMFSMLIGFFFWYHGLAVGGVAAVGQLQLLQPFLGLFLSAFLLGETISAGLITASTSVLACVVLARRFT